VRPTVDTPEQGADSQRSTRRERRERIRHARELVLACALLAFLWGLANSPLVFVTQVSVQADDAALTRRACSAIRVPREASTLFYPLSEIERQVRGLPEAQSVEIDRVPCHLLVVTVHRRRPLAVAATGAGHFLIGADGIVAGLVPAGQAPPKVPVLDNLLADTARPGQGLPAWAVWIMTQATSAARRGGLQGDWHLDCAQSFDLYISYQGVKGFLGSTDNLGRKVELFATLLRELRRRGQHPAYLDVRVPDRPVWGPAP
jgi:cell division septal protein FtsQ